MFGLRKLLRTVLLGRSAGLRARILAALRRQKRPEQNAGPPTVSAPQAESVDASASDGAVRACAFADLREDAALEQIVGGVPLALLRVGDGAVAVHAVCPHAGGPIAEGDVSDGQITCPWHGWSFSLADGSCEIDADCALPVYPTSVRGPDVFVQLGSAP